MIQNDEELAVVRKQLATIEHALESLRLEVLPKNPQNFEVFSEGYVDQIAELQAEIEAYRQTSVRNDSRSAKTRRGRKQEKI